VACLVAKKLLHIFCFGVIWWNMRMWFS
jgi:hypothetical protein